MVIRGSSRGNGRQLATYLLTMKDNEAIRILEVDGQYDANENDLHNALYTMHLSSELSRSEKGLYHAQINPAIGEDSAMNDDHWREASDILAKNLGLENQRRAIVLHSKKGRTHAHVVWERYDHDNERMVPDSFSRLAQDRARKEMEVHFGHKQTPHRNRHRPELKASLTDLWHQTGTGAQFVKAASANGYIIAEGSGRSPFMVVDELGRSYDLTRQLQGVKLKEVRQRLRHETLLGEKEAIGVARKKRNDSGTKDKGTEQSSSILKTKFMAENFSDNKQDITSPKQQAPKMSLKDKFAANRDEATKSDKQKAQPQQQAQKPQSSKDQFNANTAATGQQPKKSLKDKFAENRDEATKPDKQPGKGKTDQGPKPGGPKPTASKGKGGPEMG